MGAGSQDLYDNVPDVRFLFQCGSDGRNVTADRRETEHAAQR